MFRKCVLCNSAEVRPIYRLKNIYRDKQFQLHMSGEGRLFSADIRDNTLLFCNGCGLVFRSLTPQYDVLQRNYEERYEYSEDEIKKKLDEHYTSSGRRVLEEIEWLKEHAPKFKEGTWKMLDVGSREGLTVKLFADMGWDAYGIEPTRTLTKGASRLYGLNIKNSMYEEDSFPADSFDFIYASQVIHRYDDIGLFFRSSHKHLKKGGNLFVEVCNVYDIKINTLTEQHRVYFSANTLRQAAQKYGFKEMAIETEKPMGGYAGMIYALFEKVGQPLTFKFNCLDDFNKVKKAVIGADYCFANHSEKLNLNSVTLSLVSLLERYGLATLNRPFVFSRRGCNSLKRRLTQKKR